MLLEWRTLVAKEKEKQLIALIKEENLKDAETGHFMTMPSAMALLKQRAQTLII